MRGLSRVRALIFCTVGAGAAVVSLALVQAGSFALDTLTYFAAAALLTELLVIPRDETSPDPRDSTAFSFSATVHIATVLVLGPWAGALIAAWGVVAADGLRGNRPRIVLFNAATSALATLAGGYAYLAAGGEVGTLPLPQALPAIAVLALVIYGVGAFLVAAVIAFDTSASLPATAQEAFRSGAVAAMGEAGLGVVLAHFVLVEPWGVVALIPLLVAVYRSQERLVTLRRETANALETFANVVDERDTYTFRHSARVADYVRDLAGALGFPASAVARIRWAGRLHDLGKITVDASVLSKPGKLDDTEWEIVRRHPRLSSRLLRRFHLAVDHARAVEYHHERADGRGYYSIAPADIPLTAHFLIVADSYDAMTSDRPYRKGLPVEVALEEIERNAGTQFHPVVAKAFVALQRGDDVLAALDAGERTELRRLLVAETRRSTARERLPDLPTIAAAGMILALLLIGTRASWLAGPSVTVAAAALVFSRLERRRARRLAGRMRRILAGDGDRGQLFSNLASALSVACDIRWVGLVEWDEQAMAGRADLEWPATGQAPGEAPLTSWLLRDLELARASVVTPGAELGDDGEFVAVPVRDEGLLVAFLVAKAVPRVPQHLKEALEACQDDLARVARPATAAGSSLHVVAAG